MTKDLRAGIKRGIIKSLHRQGLISDADFQLLMEKPDCGR